MRKIDKTVVKEMQERMTLSAENAQLKADLAYVMMMTGVEIPEEEKDGAHV